MKDKKNTPWAVITVCVIIFVAIIAVLLYVRNQQKLAAPKAEFTSFTIDQAQHQYVAEGTGLRNIEIWYVTAGKNQASSPSHLLTNMFKDTDGITWYAAIPDKELNASQIYARGYDSKGNLVKEISLPAVK